MGPPKQQWLNMDVQKIFGHISRLTKKQHLNITIMFAYT